MSRKTEITSFIKGGEELNLSELRNLYYQAVLKSRYQETNWWRQRVITTKNYTKVSVNEYNKIPFRCYSNTILLLLAVRSTRFAVNLSSDVLNLQAYDMQTGNEITEVTLIRGSDAGSTSKIIGRENGYNVYLNYAYVALKFDNSGTYTDSDGILTSKMCYLQISDKFNRASYSDESKLNSPNAYFRLIEVFPGLDNGYATITENEVISEAFLQSLKELQENKFDGPTPGAVNRISNYILPIIAPLKTNKNKYNISAQMGTIGKSFIDGYFNTKLDGSIFSTQKLTFMNKISRANYTFTTLSDSDYDFSEADLDLYTLASSNYIRNYKLQKYSTPTASVYSDTPTNYKWKEFDVMGQTIQDIDGSYSEKMVMIFQGSDYFSFLNFGATQFLEGFANTYKIENLSQFWKFYNEKIATGETPIDNISLSILLNTFKSAFWRRNIDVIDVDCSVTEVKSEISSTEITFTRADYTANVKTEADLGFFCDLIYNDDGSTYDIDIPSLNIYINFKPIF